MASLLGPPARCVNLMGLARMPQTARRPVLRGHVGLPRLEAEAVRTGWVSQDAFLAGYGAVQALPSPVFTFAAFLAPGDTVQSPTPNGWLGGLIATEGIFLPAFLLLFGVLPFWLRLRGHPAARAALAGINAAVVALLLAALYESENRQVAVCSARPSRTQR
ncbi:MAG: chromate transporter [Thiohalocapsa sp.]